MIGEAGSRGASRALAGALAAALFALAACSAPPQTIATGDGPPAQVVTAPAAPSALGSYLAARHAQEVHDYAAAAKMMEQALQQDPNNFDLVRRSFVLRVTEGRIAEAVPLAHKIVDLDGNSGLPALVLLVSDIKAGNFEAAATRARSLAADGPQRFAMPLLTAWIEAARQRPGPARQAMQRMAALRGLEPLRDLHLGLMADLADRTEEAQEAYEKLLASEQQPTWRVVEVVGNFYERHSRGEAARQLYERFASDDAETDAATAGLARIAAGTIPSRVVASPAQGAAEALFDLASLLNQRETLDAALIYARLALELQPDFPLAGLLAAEIRERQGRTEDAIALYRGIDPHSPLAWSARLRVALSLDVVDKTDEAVATLRTMAQERPSRAEPLIELGDILRAHNRFDEATHAYDAAIARLKINKKAWRVFYDRGVALERSSQWSRAEADLKRALELDPEQPMALNYLGYSWIDRGVNLNEGLKLIQRAVELRPNDGYIVDSLGWAFYRLGDFTRASQFLERAIELLPEDPTINDHLGDAYWRTGRLAEARFQWRRALQFGPEAGEIKNIETKLDRGLAQPPQALSSGG